MKKFILHTLLFSLAVVLLVFAANRNYFPSQKDPKAGYMGAMIDKHAYADRAASPRLVFCGGSNLAFGLNSKRIENSLGLPVINLGLYGGLGLDFMLKEAEYTARPNDVVIVSIEYFLDISGDYQAKREAAQVYPPASGFFRPTLRQVLSDFFIEDLQKNLTVTAEMITGSGKRTPSLNVYSRSAFNAQGDVVHHFEKNPPHGFLKNFRLQYRYYDGFDLLNAFKERMTGRHIRVYFLYPNFPASLYRSEKKTIEHYSSDIRTAMTIPALNTPESAVMADSLFYDTQYHLQPAGREMQTDRIINLVKRGVTIP